MRPGRPKMRRADDVPPLIGGRVASTRRTRECATRPLAARLGGVVVYRPYPKSHGQPYGCMFIAVCSIKASVVQDVCSIRTSRGDVRSVKD
jgi:hypothetical protein